jgi:raffinose/stachyose/melibiose transport system permease protein
MLNTKLKIRNIVSKIVYILFGTIFMYPFIWMLLISFKSANEIYSNAYGLPDKWLFSNYIVALSKFDFPRYMLNSAIYVAASVFLILLSASLFAYATSRLKWRLNGTMMSYISLGLIIPVPVIIIPLFLLVKDLNIKNTYFELIFPYTAHYIPLSVLILYGYLRTLPFELEESAFCDGCSVIRAFFSIILPMIKAGIITVATIIFLRLWNEFFIAFMISTKKELRPIPIGLLNFMTNRQVEWGLMGAAMVVSALPTLIIYLVFSEKIEKALTAGAILK